MKSTGRVQIRLKIKSQSEPGSDGLMKNAAAVRRSPKTIDAVFTSTLIFTAAASFFAFLTEERMPIAFFVDIISGRASASSVVFDASVIMSLSVASGIRIFVL